MKTFQCAPSLFKKTPKCDFETEPEADLFLLFHFFVSVTEQTEQDLFALCSFIYFPFWEEESS